MPPKSAPPLDDDLQADPSANDLIKAAANGTPLSSDDAQDALAAFLAVEGETSIEPKSLKLNVGSDEHPIRVKWMIGPIEDTEISRIRDQSRRGRRGQRGAGQGEIDENLVAAKIVAAGTIEPDVRQLAQKVGVSDPADAVRAYFRKFGKTGMLTQISGQILDVSGWNDEDVQALEVEAAQG